MGGQTIRNEAERVADIRVQTSAYGSTIPWLLTGRARGAGNLLWYGNFRAIKHTSTTNSGGKGGGGVRQETVTYTYEAAVVVGLARGPLLSAGAVWRGKQQLPSLAAAGLSFAQGDVGQPMWSWLQGYAPAEALNYSGLAYAYAQAYSLDDSAALPNHNFELDAGGLGSVVGVMEPVVDGDPRLAVERLLTDARSGAGWPLERLQGLDRYQTYCRAAGLWLSPLLSEQRSALDWLRQLLMLTNTRAAWTGSALELVPMGDETISAHGVTYEANTTPDFDLTLDHFQPDEDEPPVRVRRHVGLASEAAAATTDDVGFNVITLEIENRAAGYALQPITRDDLASIERYGRRPKDTIKAPEVKDPAIGAQICQQLLQDELVKRNRYEFTLSWKFSRLRPLRLVTLTEPSLDLDRTPVRVLEVEELDDRRVAVVAEDAPIGTASAPRYGTQAGKGFDQNYAVAPGTVTDVAIFEAPAPLAAGGTGLEVWCAVASPGGPWGGCTVWVSLDGDSYRQMGRVTGGARMGLLAEPVAGALLEVHSMTGQLVGASAADAQALATLSVVLGAEPEYLAYQGAMLTGASAYTLSGLVRGAYGTPSPTHAAGDRFVRIDGDIAKSGGLDVGLIGKRIWFKFTSFNVFGVAEQSLADVSAHAYDITGVFARLAPGTAGRGLQLKASALAVKQDASGDRLPAAITLTAELKGTLLGAPVWSVRSGAATLSGSGMQRIVDTSTLVPPARIRVELTDEVGTYADEVTLTVLENGADGVSGNKYALVSLYQWSTTQPGAPSGESTWAWASARHSAYTGGNGWQVGIPPNPGFPGVLLWAASQQISAGGGTVSSQLTWSAGSATISAVGANGVGMQSAEAAVYAWASNLAALPPLTGVSTYTWASSSLDAAPAGWSLAPGAVAGPGLTLFKAVVRLTDATTSATSNVDWTLSGTSAVGFAGVSGAPGQAGASARIAYTKVTGATIGAGTVETDGPASLPLDNAWGRGEVWSATVPAFGPDESVMQTNGVYNPATGKTVWGSPYLSSWRVGKLSSITADIGSITAGSLNIGGGRFQVSASGYLVARGAQLLDEAGNVVFSTKAGASAQLPASWVSAAPEWLNSNVTPQSIGIRTFTISSTGYTAPRRLPPGLWEGSTQVSGEGAWWNFRFINRQTGALDIYRRWHPGDPQSVADEIAHVLDGNSRNWVVVVWTNDHPTGNMPPPNLLEAMYRIGASRTKLGGATFRNTYRAAYALVGVCGAGEGTGLEMTSPGQDTAIELSFTLQGGQITGSSGGRQTIVDYGYTGDLNATHGATIGQNLNGAFSQSSWDVVMPNALIKASHIQSLSVNVLATTMSGNVTPGEGIRLEANKFMVFSGGQEVVRVGYLF